MFCPFDERGDRPVGVYRPILANWDDQRLHLCFFQIHGFQIEHDLSLLSGVQLAADLLHTP
jgi:hypothetical protein